MILASISINMLTGENAIIQNAIMAKEKTEINNEKELLQIASTQAMQKDKFGDITENGIKDQLKKIEDKTPTNVIKDEDIFVSFPDSQRVYSIDKDGVVEYLGDMEDAKSIIRISATPDHNTKPELVQNIRLKIFTFMEYNNDELEIHYEWTTDGSVEPEQYNNSVTLKESDKSRTKYAEVSLSGSEGNYYLWVQVKVKETGKEKIEKFGPYALKENTTLVAAENNRSSESYFLNNDKYLGVGIKRKQIKKITFTDSIDGHSASDNNCWDVSTNKKGKILAWYKQIDGTDFYEITIGENGGVVANTSCACLFQEIGYQDISGEWTPTVIDGLNNLDTSNVTNMGDMFRKMNTLQSLNLRNFDTSKVGYMGYMFYGCSNLTSLDLKSFNTAKVTSMVSMFGTCSKITEIEWDTDKFVTDKVTNLSAMFWECKKLEKLDVSNWDTSKNKTLYGTFFRCNSLTELDVSNWNTSNVDTTLNGFHSTFGTCTKLKELDLRKWDVSKAKWMDTMFSGCSSLTKLDVSTWNVENFTSLPEVFKGCSSLEELDVSKWKPLNATSISGMFNGCKKLKKLDLGDWQTPKLTSMGNMFYECSSLEEIDVSGIDTSNVKSFIGVFANCKKITTLDVSMWNVENVTTLGGGSWQGAFPGCDSLTHLDTSNWNTSNVTNMGWTFRGTKNLDDESLNMIAQWDVTNVTNFSGMFNGATKYPMFTTRNGTWNSSGTFIPSE